MGHYEQLFFTVTFIWIEEKENKRVIIEIKEFESYILKYFFSWTESRGAVYPATLHIKSPFDPKNCRIQGTAFSELKKNIRLESTNLSDCLYDRK